MFRATSLNPILLPCRSFTGLRATPLGRTAGTVLLGMLALVPTALAQRGSFHPGRNEVSLVHDTRIRTALVYLPSNTVAPDSGWPLVLMLHGAGGSTENVVEGTGWATVGEQEGFICIFPNGTPADEQTPESFLHNPQTWNCGPGVSLAAGNRSATAKRIDDVGFLAELIHFVERCAPIDRHRLFVCGHSNGASMAYRFAYERSDLVAAVGVMAGHFQIRADRAIAPVSLIQIVGDKDPFTPMNGGEAGIGGVRMDVPAALDGPREWAAAVGLDSARAAVNEDVRLTIRTWGPDTRGTEVRSIVVKGHGHGYLWPKAKQLPGFLVGPTRESINATESFWVFFRAHPKSERGPR